MINIIMIVLVLIASCVGIYLWIKKTSSIVQEDEDFNPYDIKYIEEGVSDTLQATLKRSLRDMNLSKDELEKQERIKRELREAIRNASVGDMQAKLFVKQSILGIICDSRRPNYINENTIDDVIDFSNPDNMTIKDQFEAALYIYSNRIFDAKNQTYGPDGLKMMFKDYGFDKVIPGTTRYEVTSDQISDVYKELISEHTLSFGDKREILAQRIFEDLYGFGPVDVLLDTSCDEVMGGLSGIPSGSFQFKNAKILEGASYSYESIWIGMSGLTIHLKFLSFGSQSELVRVCNNIYKYDAPTVMSRNMGKAVSTMKDGSRIVCFRPPFADSYGFIARKFDSAGALDIENIVRDEGGEIPITVLKWIIRSCCNTIITGDQGTGKTTMMKALIKFIREDYTLRIQELTPELNLRYIFPDRNILSFRETETISTQEGLDLQKKTSGTINIIGEIATAEAASWFIQSAKVGSKMGFASHHAKTTKDLVVSIRNNMIQTLGFNNDASVDEMVADALNIDIHLERKKGHRFIGRITEIIPIRDRSYPEEDISVDMDDETLKKKMLINEAEYEKRMTDRILFTWRDIVKYNEDLDRYEFTNHFTPELFETMKAALTREEEAEMLADFARLDEIANGQPAHYVNEDVEDEDPVPEDIEDDDMEDSVNVLSNDDDEPKMPEVNESDLDEDDIYNEESESPMPDNNDAETDASEKSEPVMNSNDMEEPEMDEPDENIFADDDDVFGPDGV